jgi:hypothetical protein
MMQSWADYLDGLPAAGKVEPWQRRYRRRRSSQSEEKRQLGALPIELVDNLRPFWRRLHPQVDYECALADITLRGVMRSQC